MSASERPSRRVRRRHQCGVVGPQLRGRRAREVDSRDGWVSGSC